MLDIYYAYLWNGQLWFYREEPVFWEGMSDDFGIVPLCNDAEYY